VNLPPRALADAALRQFKLRQRHPTRDHEAKLRPWAALALRCGADPAAISPDVGAALEELRRGGVTESLARTIVADDLCPLSEALAELARARKAAFDALPLASNAAPQSTQDLAVLAIHLGCEPYLPTRQKQAA
jgi:hypothetical protein